jgi:hypothetical protein
MRKLVLLSALFLASPALAQLPSYPGYCQLPAKPVVTNGVASSTLVLAIYPKCTVTVFNTGTLTPATIFSDPGGTSALGNPFQAKVDGSFLFFASGGLCYDVNISPSLSGGTPVMPGTFTFTDVCFGSGSQVSVPAGTTGYLAIYKSVGSIGSDANIDDSITTPFPPTITSKVNLAAPTVAMTSGTAQQSFQTGLSGSPGTPYIYLTPDPTGVCAYYGGPSQAVDQFGDLFGVPIWISGTTGVCYNALLYLPLPNGATPSNGQTVAYNTNAPGGATFQIGAPLAQQTFANGLGAISQILGPTDQDLQIGSQNNKNVNVALNGTGLFKVNGNPLVNSVSAAALAYYAASGTSVSGDTAITTNGSGTLTFSGSGINAIFGAGTGGGSCTTPAFQFFGQASNTGPIGAAGSFQWCITGTSRALIGTGAITIPDTSNFCFSQTSSATGTCAANLNVVGTGATEYLADSTPTVDQGKCQVNALAIATSATTICTFTLPNAATALRIDCSLSYAESSTTTLALDYQFAQAPTNSSFSAEIKTSNANAATEATITTAGTTANTILTGGTPGATGTYLASLFGTFTSSATSGTLLIQGTAGTGSAVTVSGGCWLR